MALQDAGSGRAESVPGVGGHLTEKLLETGDLAFVSHLLLFGILDEFENLLHVGESLMEGVHHAFDLQHGLFDGAGGGGAVGKGLNGSRDGAARFLGVFLTGRFAAFGGIVPIPGLIALPVAGLLTAAVLTTLPGIPGIPALFGSARSFLDGCRGRFFGVRFLGISGVGVVRFLMPMSAFRGVVLGRQRVVGGFLITGGLGSGLRVIRVGGFLDRRGRFGGDRGFGVLRGGGFDRRQIGGGFERGIGGSTGGGGKDFLLTGLWFGETALGAEGAAAGAVTEGRTTGGGTCGWILGFGTHELRIGMGR